MELAETHGFAEHHAYRPHELAKLVARAQALGATLVTTEKDAVRLSPDQLSEIQVLAVNLAWRDPAAIDGLFEPLLDKVGTSLCNSFRYTNMCCGTFDFPRS